jgi:hypothetical protein
VPEDEADELERECIERARKRLREPDPIDDDDPLGGGNPFA